MRRILFLGEGTSDKGLTEHIQRIAEECGIDTRISAPDVEMLPSPDRSVPGKLRSIRQLGGGYDVVFVHRDADRDGRDRRVREIADAMNAEMAGVPHAPVIPIRMTEAWLVLDEPLLREVAGNPNGRVQLRLPSHRDVERIADPKALLRELLTTAADLTGRKRRSFQERFPAHRARLLERLDPSGPVSKVQSWRDFESDARAAFASLTS